MSMAPLSLAPTPPAPAAKKKPRTSVDHLREGIRVYIKGQPYRVSASEVRDALNLTDGAARSNMNAMVKEGILAPVLAGKPKHNPTRIPKAYYYAVSPEVSLPPDVLELPVDSDPPPGQEKIQKIHKQQQKIITDLFAEHSALVQRARDHLQKADGLSKETREHVQKMEVQAKEDRAMIGLLTGALEKTHQKCQIENAILKDLNTEGDIS